MNLLFILTRKHLLLLICLFTGQSVWSTVFAESVIGWVDRAEIHPEGITVSARMDSGAKTSSLRGEIDKQFVRKGEQWIRVSFVGKKNHRYTLERKIVRKIKIKQHNGLPTSRLAISLGICIGNIYKEVDVTIAERGKFNYPLLIGRNFLAGSFLIDSGKTFTVTDMTCKNKPQ